MSGTGYEKRQLFESGLKNEKWPEHGGEKRGEKMPSGVSPEIRFLVMWGWGRVGCYHMSAVLRRSSDVGIDHE